MTSLMGIDDAFFNRTRVKRVGVVGPELGLSLGRFVGFGRWTSLQKQERMRVDRGFVRGRSDA